MVRRREIGLGRVVFIVCRILRGSEESWPEVGPGSHLFRVHEVFYLRVGFLELLKRAFRGDFDSFSSWTRALLFRLLFTTPDAIFGRFLPMAIVCSIILHG